MNKGWDFITDRLATGGAVQTLEDVEELVSHGITHVIDATEQSLEIDNSRAWMAIHPALSVLWQPTPDDGTTKGPDWFGPVIEFGLMALSHPLTKIYAHCFSGENRGPSMVFSILLATGWSYDEAIERIHTARPVTKGYMRYASDAANALREMGYYDI